MFERDLKNGFVVREVSVDNFWSYLDPHFASVFKNRADDYKYFEIDEESKKKISKRAEAQRFSVRLVIFKGEEVVGWHYGYEKEPEVYYMQNSAVLEQYRNQGLYSQLLHVALERVRAEGFQVIVSTHHPHNSAVLVPKLKCGFFISGLVLNERFRSLIELKLILNEERRSHHYKNLGLEL